MKIQTSLFFAVRIAISTCCVIVLNSASAQSGWQWAKSGSSKVFAVGTDAAGNVYAGGSYGPDILTKYDAAGSTMWTLSAGDSANAYVIAEAVEASGSVYVTGKFQGIMTAAADTLHSASMLGCNFIAKYDAAGHPLWARLQDGGTSSNTPVAASRDGAGNIYVAGHFLGDSLVLGSTILHNVTPNWSEIYLVKYGPTGSVLWAKTIGTIDNEEAYSLATDNAGDVYVTGTFRTVPLVLDTFTLSETWGENTFIVKYNSAGNVLWAKSIDHTQPAAVHVNAGGDVYLTGLFSTIHTIGTATLVPTSGATTTDIFLIKYTAAGGVAWAVKAGSEAIAKAITTDPAGNIFMTGWFDTTAIFGTTTLTGIDFRNLFLAKYDDAGNLLAATRTQSSGTGTASYPGQGVACIAADPSGNVYVGGEFWGNDVVFGTHVITNATSNPAFFLAKSGNTFLMTTEVVAASAALSVYPNPSGGLVTVSIPAKKYDQLTVYNALGTIIYKGSITTMETNRQIQLGDLSSGQYYVRASGPDGAETVPVVLSH